MRSSTERDPRLGQNLCSASVLRNSNYLLHKLIVLKLASLSTGVRATSR